MSELPSRRGEPKPRQQLVRPYFLTQGRTVSYGRELPFEAIITVVDGVTGPTSVAASQVLGQLTEPRSIAEIAAYLRLPIGVVRVVVGDLEADGLVAATTVQTDADNRIPVAVLERFLDDLQAF